MRDFRKYPSWVHLELVNWTRYCWQGSWPHPIPPDHCTSIESRYLAPAGDTMNDEPPRPRPIINAHRAMWVQDIYDGLPQMPKLVLRAEYPQYQQSGRAEFGMAGAARRLKISLREYEENLTVAVGRVWDAFEKRGLI